MGPSSTIGAVSSVRLRAPTKVVVFQCPCGTGARQRSPLTGAAVKPGHLGGRAGLIDEHELVGIQVELPGKPGPATRQNIRPLLFGCVRGFFCASCHDAAATATPCSAPPQARDGPQGAPAISPSVMSGVPSISGRISCVNAPRSDANACHRPAPGAPDCRSCAIDQPSAPQSKEQHQTVQRLPGASCRPSTASITRFLRSLERGVVMHAGLRTPACMLNQNKADLGIHQDSISSENALEFSG